MIESKSAKIPKDTKSILVFATDWLKARRADIYKAFATRLFATPEESAELTSELAEIESALEGEE